MRYMSVDGSVQRSFRLAKQTADLLDQAAEQSPMSRNALADRLLGEALRLERHPRIRYRQGYSGRRQACIDGTRLYVHQAISTLRDLGGDPRMAAETFGVDEGAMTACLAFYAEYRDEIDVDADLNQRFADDEQERWEREQRTFA